MKSLLRFLRVISSGNIRQQANSVRSLNARQQADVGVMVDVISLPSGVQVTIVHQSEESLGLFVDAEGDETDEGEVEGRSLAIGELSWNPLLKLGSVWKRLLLSYRASLVNMKRFLAHA